MSIHIRALGTCIGAAVDGIDLREPLSSAQASPLRTSSTSPSPVR